jgi:hypothetical protein
MVVQGRRSATLKKGIVAQRRNNGVGEAVKVSQVY